MAIVTGVEYAWQRLAAALSLLLISQVHVVKFNKMLSRLVALKQSRSHEYSTETKRYVVSHKIDTQQVMYLSTSTPPPQATVCNTYDFSLLFVLFVPSNKCVHLRFNTSHSVLCKRWKCFSKPYCLSRYRCKPRHRTRAAWAATLSPPIFGEEQLKFAPNQWTGHRQTDWLKQYSSLYPKNFV